LNSAHSDAVGNDQLNSVDCLLPRNDEEDFDDALIEAREDVAALHLLENLQVQFDAEATKLADAWLTEYKDRVNHLQHDRQDAYRQIVALSTQPQDVDLAQPGVTL
jgi:type III restriction enzyme